MTRRWLRPWAVTAVMALLPAVPHAANAAEPYQIEVILPLTGYGAFLGKEEQIALGVIERKVNKAGGVNGRAIHFAVHDDQSSPQLAVQLANQVIANKAPFFLGSTVVADCRATEALLRNGPVEFCFSPGVHPPAGSYLFSNGASTTDLIAAAARYFRDRGWKKVALITSTDATGQDAEQNVEAVFARPENAGETLVTKEHFNTSDVSVAAQMQHVKASGAQAVIAWSTGTGFGTLLRGAQQAAIDVPILTTNGNLTYAQMKSYAGFLPKELYFAGIPMLAENALPDGAVKNAVREFIGAFKAAGVRPDMGMNQAWDPAYLAIGALRKLGFGATAQQVRAYLADLRGWAGVNGEYDFTAVPQRGVGISSVPILRWDAAKDTWIGVSRLGGEAVR